MKVPKHLADAMRAFDGVTIGPPAKLPWVWKRIYRSEKEFQADVVAFAKARGWTVHHNPDSRKCESGLPDLICWRGPDFKERLVVAELKIGQRLPTPTQHACLASFAYAIRGPGVYVWRPEHVGQIETVLGDAT